MVVIQNKLVQHSFSEPVKVEELKDWLEAYLANILNISIREATKRLQSVYKGGKTLKKKTNMLLGAGFASAIALVMFLVFAHAVFY